MKIIAAILALFVLCVFARADDILIYRGFASQKSSTGNGKSNGYYLFDLTTSQFASVTYQDAHGDKTYTASGGVPFTNLPVQTTADVPESNFLFGSTVVSGTSTYQLGVFHGKDKAITLDPAPSAEIARILAFAGYYFTGTGTTGSDYAATDTGMYRLDEALSKESAAGNSGTGDTLSEAIGIVTALLMAKHYTAAP